jgi:hypothetical protein
VLSRTLLPALLLAACSGAAGNDNTGAPATNVQPPAPPSPIAGLWSQTSPPCATGTPPPARVEELEFEPGGRALVTFGAFETYHDYWGPYRYDAATGAHSISVERGNAVPTDLDLEGRANLTPTGELVLNGISFGTPAGAGPENRNCTLRFVRRR